MKKVLFFLITFLPVISMASSDIVVDGIHYSIFDTSSKKCKVVKDTENSGFYTASNYEGLVVIPSSIKIEGEDYSVARVDNYAFYQSHISFISLPNTIEEIGENAFDGCNSLEKITLSERITEIPKYCFARCENLKNIDIPASIKVIKEGAFQYCGVKELNMPNGVVEIGDFAFSDTKNLEKINIPDACEKMGLAIFRNSPKLNNLQISKNHPAFVLADNVLYSKDYSTLYYCIPSCSGDIILDKRTVSVMNSAFYGCANIKNIEFNEGLEYIGNLSFYNCTGIEKLTLPKGLLYLGSGSFEGCASINTIIIPNTVREIDGFCFMNCNISELTIPGSVEKIGDKAFYMCYNLSKVNIRATTPPARTTYLFPLDNYIELHVLKGCKELYEADSYWSNKTTIIADLDPIQIEKIRIAKDEYNIDINETYRAVAIVYPDDADASITWSSSNESVVYIDKSGTFIGISEGEAEIFAKAENNDHIFASAKVRVGKSTDICDYNSKVPHEMQRYDLNGRITNNQKRGLYIIKMDNGVVYKKYVK